MGLVVSAQVIRELIADGEYLVDCIEQRQHGKVAATFSLRSRAQPYDIQIETSDSKLEGLFRALLPPKEGRSQKTHLAQLGGQTVPVVEVAALPADTPRKRGRRKTDMAATQHVHPVEAISPAKRRRDSASQLVLMPQEGSMKAEANAVRPRRNRPSKVREGTQP